MSVDKKAKSYKRYDKKLFSRYDREFRWVTLNERVTLLFRDNIKLLSLEESLDIEAIRILKSKKILQGLPDLSKTQFGSVGTAMFCAERFVGIYDGSSMVISKNLDGTTYVVGNIVLDNLNGNMDEDLS